MKNLALVPVKGLDAKKRLANYLSLDDRKRLVRAMLLDVLKALSRSKLFDEITIISPDETVCQEIERNKVTFIRQNGIGLNAAVHQATQLVLRNQVASMTTVLADLPLLSPPDLEEIMRIGKATPRVVLAPSSKGGTNVMLRAPSNAIGTSYGRWSYAKHLRTAQEKETIVYSVSNPRLSFDVDTIEDLRTLRQVGPRGSNAGRLARDLGPLHPLARTGK